MNMAAQIQTLEDPGMREIGPTLFRKPQGPGSDKLPNVTEIISADGHWEIQEDIFYEAVPQHLKHKAPRVWFDRVWRIGNPDDQAAQLSAKVVNIMEEANSPGLYDLDVRLEHMIAEGVDREIVFPQTILFYFGMRDLELKESIFRVYNEYIARRSAEKPGRFYGVGILSNWWDPAKAEGAVQQIVDLGLKTFMIPTNPGKDAAGADINYGSESMEPLFRASANSGLPLSLHIAENFDVDGRGKFPANVLSSFTPFRKSFGQLIFGGVFDRNPELQVVFAEGGINWVASALQDAEMIYDSYGYLSDPLPRHRPSHYWRKNCYATFQNDRLGLQLLDYIGAERIMWASDYPHPEGSFGFNYSSRQSVLDATSPEEAALILGGTAKELFGL